MLTSVVIITYNKLDYTKQCIESIRQYTEPGTYEIIVVDNNSTDDTPAWLKTQEDIKVILNEENLGFPRGCNQGILVAAGDNILLLNNDTVVTHNWLNNILKCLHSSEDIGAVGAVSNYCPNFQTISVSYETMEEMHNFAKDYNISNPAQWEDRLRLIGFCLLIKREVIEKIGVLDGIFSPGNYEDDDYSIRMRMAGYRLILCKDTFIHHYGSISFSENRQNFANVLKVNEKKFEDKWGINPHEFMDIRKDIVRLMEEASTREMNILQIGCEAGGTLYEIKSKYPNAKLYATEKREELLINMDKFAKIAVGDAQTLEFEYKENFFDYILITDMELTADKILKLVGKIRRYLKNSGRILISVTKDRVNADVIIQVLKYKLAGLEYETFDSYGQIIILIKDIKDKSSETSKPSDRKICFISCVNDQFRYRECIRCIRKLTVPEGYEVENIFVKNVTCITEAYNEVMSNIDAKYKIYIHQDALIIYKSFIVDVVELFKKYPNLGMMGVAGCKYIPSNGIWWSAIEGEKYGEVFDNHTGKMQLLYFGNVENDYGNVKIIDGLIMLTQYDIPWRGDLFKGWHFYDASQSIEFIKAGYEVGVPKQNTTWCIHDCGSISLNSEYEDNRRIFVKEYGSWMG